MEMETWNTNLNVCYPSSIFMLRSLSSHSDITSDDVLFTAHRKQTLG